MKERALVTLDLENKKIINLRFEDPDLNMASGMGQIKAFIRRKVLNTPIQNFTPVMGENKVVYVLPLIVDVYPIVKKALDIPYRCKLLPLPPIGKESDISFGEFKSRYSRRKMQTITN